MVGSDQIAGRPDATSTPQDWTSAKTACPRDYAYTARWLLPLLPAGEASLGPALPGSWISE